VKLILLYCLFLCSLGSAYEPTPEEAAATNTALDHWTKVAKDSSSRPSEEIIWELGRVVRKLAREEIYPSERRVEVHQLVQQRLISTPGHAEFFANKIRNDDILRETGRGHEVQGGVVWDFETLGQLPSPETVKVLGSFLDDERHRRDPPPGADVMPVAANNLLAARALHSLKIVHPPLQKRPGSYDDIQPWRLWFAQVEAGNRTFRFEGNPQEYSLAGPVAEARVPQSRPSTGPDPANRPESPQGPGGEERAIPVVPLIAAGLFLVSALWLATRKKASAE
jgi:hypothetical protein